MHNGIHLVNFILILLPFSKISCDDLLTNHKVYVTPWPDEPSSCNSSCPNNSVRCDTLGNYTDLLIHSNVEPISHLFFWMPYTSEFSYGYNQREQATLPVCTR